MEKTTFEFVQTPDGGSTEDKQNDKHNVSHKEVLDLFRVVFRNYLSLVTLADRKAGLLIHVNAIIISVTFAFSIRHVESNKVFVWPMASILIVAVATIYCSILGSRPQEGLINHTLNIEEDRLFFGSFDKVDNHFKKMPWDQYERFLDRMFNGPRKDLLKQMQQETFLVRKVLANKFNYISLAYKIFKYGLLFSTLILLIVLFKS